MSELIEYSLNMASESQLVGHLQTCDADFVPPLSGRVEIRDYAKKIASKATRFEAWSGNTLVGLLAVYCNDEKNRIAYITSVSVLRAWNGKGIAVHLLNWCIEHATTLAMRQIRLNVSSDNTAAITLYEKCGFVPGETNPPFVSMNRYLTSGETMNTKRDYNSEIRDTNDHKYAYSFDFDVMHPFMVKSFEPFFNKGNLLELGSFKGDFTRRLLPYFDDITCVEASKVAIEEAKKKLTDTVKFVNATFEKITLPRRYDNIVMTHVLEHLDDPVLVLKRVNDEWLSEKGRFLLVCPNANAPSRQIAVKMGLISHNTAVTPAEAEHGHRCTYSSDTLERDAVAAGLRVIHRSGIFFKALANFQWDRLLQTDILSKEYLEGCYKLGQHYPDLCSSVFLLCERGDNT
jgi:ribosomal protein S18 acetylase RimI-like enzyme/SAM-dependent methyltransferase